MKGQPPTLRGALVEHCPFCGSMLPGLLVAQYGVLRVYRCPVCGRSWSAEGQQTALELPTEDDGFRLAP